VFVYTREAHPGEAVPHHDSFDRKLAHARLLRDETGIRRPILVDDLAGTGHLTYGGLPNMTWVVARGGRLVYKANWTSAANVESFLERYEQARRPQPGGRVLGTYETEQVEFRHLDHDAFRAHLARNGPRAVAEFRRAEEIWRRRVSG
jgi:hypothetical protein